MGIRLSQNQILTMSLSYNVTLKYLFIIELISLFCQMKINI